MTPDTLHQLLADGDWRTLFVDELGWNRYATRFEIALFEPGQQTRGWASIEERRRRENLVRYPFVLQAVAQKCGLAVFVCSPYKRGQIPTYTMRCEIERRLSKSNHHHLIVFTDGANAIQIWQWSHHTQEDDTEYCEHTVECSQPDEEFLNQLATVAFTFEEEESLTLIKVLRRVRSAFYFTRKKGVTWRVRLQGHDLSEYSEVVQAWTKQAYAERGLTWVEERHLGRAAQAGNQTAKERLVATHLYLPLEMAWKLKQRRGLAGIELEDLIHEGYFGLRSAVNTFEPDKGQRFQAHAGFWVRNLLDKAILRYSRMIAFPAYIDEKFQPIVQQYALVEDRLIQRLEREPTRWEMAAELGLKPEQMSTLDMVRAEIVPIESLLEQEEFADDRDLASISSEPMSEIESKVIMADAVEKMLSKLSPRERSVVMWRFGLCENEELTLEEVGVRLQVTRERVRQIEASALRRIQKRLQGEAMRRRSSETKATDGLSPGDTADSNQ